MEAISSESILGPHHYGQWGGWTFDPRRPSIDLGPDGTRYWVALDRLLTPAQILDFVCQISGKRWANDAILAGFMRCINDVLYPQSWACSWGMPGELTEAQMRERVRKFEAGAKSYPRSKS